MWFFYLFFLQHLITALIQDVQGITSRRSKWIVHFIWHISTINFWCNLLVVDERRKLNILNSEKKYMELSGWSE